ncbi:MAG: NTP transferase domain-containing protein, partial [Pseudomonadota bacterium]
MASESNAGPSWAIVLAAGEGSRLASVTRLLHGRDVPKQFAELDGERTLLQRTMDRVGQLVPPSRTVVVIAEEWREL